jgi:hypothetical protein
MIVHGSAGAVYTTKGAYMGPSLEHTRALPIRRAFVVQLHAEADVAHRRIMGRVEHVLSGQARRFQTLAELLEFFTHIIQAASPGDDATA